MHEVDPGQQPPETPRDATLFQVVQAVFWSFFGVRKRAAMSRDVTNIKPLQVIVVGIVLAAIIVLTLVALVQFIVS